MTSSIAPVAASAPQRTLFSVTPFVELAVLAGAIGIGIATYFIIDSDKSVQHLLSPPLVALLLVANLVPGVALLVLIGRRVAHRRAALSPIGGSGRLHVRLVALFSVIAAVPMLLVTIFASLLFQYGVEFWFSDKASKMLENTTALARVSYSQMLNRWEEATVTMAGDMSTALNQRQLSDTALAGIFAQQVFFRSLSEGVMFKVLPSGEIQTFALVNPYEVDLAKQISPMAIAAVRAGKRSYVSVGGDRIRTVTMIPQTDQLFLYAARVTDVKVMADQTRRADAVLADYRSLIKRSRSLQLQFNAALLGISLIIVGIAVWIALAVADRLVRPVGELVSAARRVEGGDLTARVAAPTAQDEVGTLANAFNAMTSRLQQQTSALVTANDQLDSRRALIEAVMSGVTAGVISISHDGMVRLINSSAIALLGVGDEAPVGQPLEAVSADLDALRHGDAREAVIQITARGEARTLAVKITGDEAGQVLTFDDITQQLLDQRRAAWSDVARRIAHEIKNPLTPIQLAAERLQRRYGKQIAADDGTFARLTETIVRQVGDLRRMVDEFSSFARMPKPVFREESLVDLARQSLFLHEVAHGDIRFALVHDEPPPSLVCDRRQIGQALTNIVKNAVEAIEAVEVESEREVVMTLSSASDGRQVIIAVADSGVGLPFERDRIIEPYMTTRARGTGLGLAIVKKIVEEHFGTMAFGDREGGGTIVTMTFDATMLATLNSGADPDCGAAEESRLSALTRNRNS
ncbi:MAG: PAS domain-containing sensor histidine kinase [Sphingomonas sp. 12-62-6]|nr:MAG: PAS domain-containing sensor histidine kinase [Sphingomonas sp. 12-62-6]